MKVAARTLGWVVVLVTLVATQAAAQGPEAEIKAVMDAQEQAWNRGDLEGFMQGYWRSPELTFFSGGTETRGWDETLARYRKAYKAQGKEMGKLTFGDLRVEMLGPESAFVRGTWKLKMSDGKSTPSAGAAGGPAKTPHGLFTLIFRKFPEGWRIVHDSTGSAN